MRLEITFRNLKPREEIRRRADVLFEKLERFLDPAADGTLVVARERDVYRVELVVVAHGEVFKADDESEDLRTAMDRMFHRIEESLRRAKDKRVDRSRGARVREDGFVDAGPADEDDPVVTAS